MIMCATGVCLLIWSHLGSKGQKGDQGPKGNRGLIGFIGYKGEPGLPTNTLTMHAHCFLEQSIVKAYNYVEISA